MGLIQNRHGVWIVRRKVPSHLQEAVARILDEDKDRRTFRNRWARRTGFLSLVDAARRRGSDAWLFPPVSKDAGAKAWTKWFGRYLGDLGINDGRKGLHSLRHNFKDALRAGGVQEDLSDALTGHSVATVGRSYGARARHGKQRHKVIVDRFGMPRLVDAISRVAYPTIDLQAVCWPPRGAAALKS